MSDEPRNGDTSPQSLRNAMRVMRGEVAKIRTVAKQQRKAGMSRQPRCYCAVCSKTFDEAMLPSDAQMQKSLCTSCKRFLQQGFTACISDTLTEHKFVFLKSPHLGKDMVGKICPVSPEAYLKIMAKAKEGHGTPG